MEFRSSDHTTGIAEAAPDDNDKESTKDKKKKRASAIGLGSYASRDVEAKISGTDKKGEKKPTVPEVSPYKLFQNAEKAKIASVKEALESKGYETKAEDLEAPADTLSAEERQNVAQVLIEQAQTGAHELTPDLELSLDVAEAAITEFHNRIINEQQDIVSARDGVLETLDDSDTAETFSDEGEEVIFEHNDQPVAAEADPADMTDEDEPEDLTTSTVVPVVPPVRPPRSGPAPPIVPPLATPPRTPVMTPAAYVAPIFPAPTPAFMHTAQAPRTEYVPNYHEHSAIGSALVGGIVGYLLGRRRGRIKTEKRLLPVQKKLRAEVADLQSQITAAETQIRVAARATAERKMAPTRAESVAAHASEQVQATKVREGVKQPNQRTPLERIGRVVINAEAAKPLKAVSKERVGNGRIIESAPTLKEKDIQTLSRAELLTVSSKIVVEGATLRQMYESHLVGERGLRRLVQEFLRGGDVQRALKTEIVERQIDFERDPILRDAAFTDAVSSSSSSQLDTLLANADSLVPHQTRHTNAEGANVTKPDKTAKKSAQQKQQHIVDVAIMSVIAVLLAIILLVAKRHSGL